MKAPAAGHLLIAQPDLLDPNFMRSVVYLVEHNADGVMGLVINRPLELSLGSIWEHCPQACSDWQCCASGGPVEPHKGLLLHGFTSLPGAYDLGHGVALGGDPGDLKQRLSLHQGLQQPGVNGPRLFLGHCGWSRQQLADEICQGSWVVRQGHPHVLLDPSPDKDLWSTLIRAGEDLPRPHPN